MYPVLFTIGSFPVRGYGLMAAAGFLLAVWTVNHNKDRAGLNGDQVSEAVTTALISGILGARLFYVIQFYRQEFAAQPWRIIRIDQGGLVFYGGFLIAMAVLLIWCRFRKADPVRVLDLFTPAIAIAHACGRIGCFLNGCCFGKPSTLPWAVTYPAGSYPDLTLHGSSCHPVQLYEAGELIVLFFVFNYLVRHCRRGVPCGLYLAFYGILRFVNELMRGDNPQLFELFTRAQLIGLLLIPAGALITFYFVKHVEKNPIHH